MAIPNFNAQGVLPPFLGPNATTQQRSPYVGTMTDLVVALGTTVHRKRLFEGLIRYRQMMHSLDFTVGFQFIDGSFVENIEVTGGRVPNDIDVFSYLEKPSKYLTDPALWTSEGLTRWAGEIADRTKNKSRFGIDSYAVAIDEPFMTIINVTMYWHGLFSHQRTTMRWKGFVIVPLNAADDAAALTLL
jgi:hypothetical protein